MAEEDFMALLVMDMTMPSHRIIKVASGDHFLGEAAISVVTSENPEHFIKAIPDATPDPPSDQSIETKFVVVPVTNLVIIQLNVLHVIMPQMVIQKTYMLLIYLMNESLSNSTSPIIHNYMTDDDKIRI